MKTMKPLSHEQTLIIDILKMAVSNMHDDKSDNKLVIDFSNVNWFAFYKLINEQGIFPFIYKKINEYIPNEIFPMFLEEYKKHIQYIDLLIDEIKEVAELAQRQNIHLVVSKGVVLSKLIYDDVYVRKAGDIDTYLNDNDVPVMHSILIEHGYIHKATKNNEEHTLPFPILKYSYVHHEYWEYIKEVSKKEYVYLELQRFIQNKITHQMQDFLNGFQMMELNGAVIKTFDVEHSLLLLTINTYVDSQWFNSGPRLKGYFDICNYYTKFSKYIDWDRIYSLSDKYNIHEVIYRVLSDVNEIFNDCIDIRIIQLFKSDTSNKLFFEWNTPVLLRIFQSELDHERSIKKQLIDRCFSHNNPNFIAPKIVDFTGGDYDKFIDVKYGFSFQFGFKRSSSCLILELHFEQRFFDSLEDFLLDIAFINEDYNESNLCKYAFCIVKNEGHIKANNVDETENKDCEIIMTSDLIYTISIPYNLIGVDKNDLPVKLAYNVSLSERMHKNVMLLISEHWYFNLEYWENPPIIQLQT
ncbi:nucleotidyltransferase family protein [Paenibacillus algorifonticola]|uniref:nucleotidyltransferase family protein n=1 Tax=Paenibacillus algorifonticola TaxID=684063 RepID=UPI003D284465